MEFDQQFLEKIKKIKYQYEGKIPESMQHYYKNILNGEDIAMYMEMFSLSETDLLKYARVCKIMGIYKEIYDLLKVINEEAEKLEKEELEEYQDIIGELQGESEEMLDDINAYEETYENTNYGNPTNIIIYPSYIDESRQKTINAHSGREEQALKGIANIIKQLSEANYQELRKKGYIHQVVQPDNNQPCYLEGNAFERIGRGPTKVNYFRIPVSAKNRAEIKQAFNIDFDTLYLVVSYGDFKNEGMDENKYYNEVFADFSKNIYKILDIIDLFKIDFTNETRPIAMKLIEDSFRLTEDYTAVIKNKEIKI